MKDRNAFILIAVLFTAFYFMPAGSGIFDSAILSGFALLGEYARQHVLTCLVPAFFIAGAIAVFVRKDAVLKYLGPRSKKYISYTVASVSGAVLAVCSCTILPIFAGIKQRGAGLGPAITFLFSGPAINVAAIFLTFSVLGPGIGIARVFSAVVLSIAIGISMGLIFREKKGEGGLVLEKGKGKEADSKIVLLFFFCMVAILVVNGLQIDAMLRYGIMGALALSTALIAWARFRKETTKEWLMETWGFSKMLVPYLFIGVFIAGFMMPLLPQELIEGLVGENTISGNLIASVFGAFMYFSTLTEVPIIQALMAKGMADGPALALLLSGPSLSLPSMLVIRRVVGSRKAAVYILLVIAYSAIAGLIFGSIGA